jgi:alcohol dehydrogenase class IV/choline kinase
MKAFIFNSGYGKRMGDLTKRTPKALVKLNNDETILGRQLRILKDNGIHDFIITTGPFEEDIRKFVNKFKDINVILINNPLFLETNNIYSLYLSREYLDDDFIFLHGDLVFDNNLFSDLPKKDFKGLIINNHIKEISVDLFGKDVYAFQPMYKLSKDIIDKWITYTVKKIKNGETGIYAETSLNCVLENSDICAYDYKNNYIDEIDNLEDLVRVSKYIVKFDYSQQKILIEDNYAKSIINFLSNNNLKRPLLVYGKHLLKDNYFFDFKNKLPDITFCEYSPNPKYEEVLDGLKVFKANNCDSIIAIGGGSCIDVAKAIKFYSTYEIDETLINKKPEYVYTKMIVVPTTAGTGTESTRYSVIYYNGEKQSLTHDCLLPNMVILNGNLLDKLPVYQRKATLLDALAQAIESYWSVNSTEESKEYSEKSIKLILKYYKDYISGSNSNLEEIMLASNYAGKAINITQTTAPHAFSYKITTLTGISHGHAVWITLPWIFSYMINIVKDIRDSNSTDYLINIFESLARIFDLSSREQLSCFLFEFFNEFKLETPKISSVTIKLLVKSVNQNRLKNNPIKMDETDIHKIYCNAFKICEND